MSVLLSDRGKKDLNLISIFNFPWLEINYLKIRRLKFIFFVFSGLLSLWIITLCDRVFCSTRWRTPPIGQKRKKQNGRGIKVGGSINGDHQKIFNAFSGFLIFFYLKLKNLEYWKRGGGGKSKFLKFCSVIVLTDFFFFHVANWNFSRRKIRLSRLSFFPASSTKTRFHAQLIQPKSRGRGGGEIQG